MTFFHEALFAPWKEVPHEPPGAIDLVGIWCEERDCITTRKSFSELCDTLVDAQAWDAHKMKYVRRAGTYTLDWQTDENRVSNQMPENMGAEAVKPADWLSKACEVQDYGLAEFVRRTFALPDDPNTMVWQLDQSAPVHQ